MTNYTEQTKPETNFTDVSKPLSGKEGRFSIAKFGKARFGNPDATTDAAKPTASHTDIARPT